MSLTPNDHLLKLTVDIVSAHAASNQVSADELAGLIRAVYTALGITTTPAAVGAGVRRESAVSIKRSVNPNYLVCLEDGKRFKALKGHLNSAHGMTPNEYRKKWCLPDDYPVVAPSYSVRRSSIARNIGLGGRVNGVTAKPTDQLSPKASRASGGSA